MYDQPTTSRNLISLGNDTFDKFLGGGFLNSSLNLFERQGPSSRLLDSVCTKESLLASLPQSRKVNTDLLYKDVRARSQISKIKIAWRYSNRNSSPSDNMNKTNQVDFGIPFEKESLDHSDPLRIINCSEFCSIGELCLSIEDAVADLSKSGKAVNIILKDLLHAFSPFLDLENPSKLLKLLLSLRCISRRLEKGATLVSFDTIFCPHHELISHHIYNLVDSVIEFHSYETGQNKLTGYKHMDGLLYYIKVPKINSFGMHFQQELSDWGYRFTRSHRFFVIDELSLPPSEEIEDDNKTKKQNATDVTNINYKKKQLEQVGPLEEFREVANEVLGKQL